VYAAVKFLPLHAARIAADAGGAHLLYNVSETSSILEWYRVPLALEVQMLLFVAFFLSFSVKCRCGPVHTWLPDAHVEAPTGGS
jgi:NADH-quinone oxidoreductase subunit M